MSNLQNYNFHSQIVDLLQSARQQVLRTVNKTMVITYFEIGRKIVELDTKQFCQVKRS